MYHENKRIWRPVLEETLREDHAFQDWTTRGLGELAAKTVRARVFARTQGCFAASGLTQAVSELFPEVQVRESLSDGKWFHPDECIAVFEGRALEVFSLERAYLNLASFSCGIATAVARCVRTIEKSDLDPKPKIAHTRKTLPGLRAVSQEAFLAGGGALHRSSLSSGILIKENHIQLAGGIQSALEKIRLNSSHGMRVEVEVRTPQEFQEAVEFGADAVLADNFSPDELKALLKNLKPPKPLIEVSGGIRFKSLNEFLIPGVDIISVGSLTHSVVSSDFSWLID